jgi:PAS domain S-box-containing protein
VQAHHETGLVVKNQKETKSAETVEELQARLTALQAVNAALAARLDMTAAADGDHPRRADRAEQALRESEAAYRHLIDFIPAAVYVCNADGSLAYCNARAAELLGRGPDGTPTAPDCSPLAGVLATGKPVVERELRVVRPDGSAIDIVVSITALRDAGGGISGAINIFQDITDRKRADAALRESETRFRALADASPALIWQGDEAGRNMYVNQRYLDVTGLTADELLGPHWRKVVHPDDAEDYGAAVARAVRERGVLHHRVRLRVADGSWHWFESHGRPWYASEHDYRGHVGISIDVNEAVEAEEALRAADRRKDEFLATLAHELRNPLAPISNALQLLRFPAGRHQIDRLLAMADRQVKQMIRMVDDLMEVTRITRGKIELRRAPVSLADILNSAVETSQPAIEQMRHRFVLALPDEPLVLDADKVRLTQVFANILNNAAKYTAPEGDIRLTAWRDGTDAMIAVRDTGMGIPPEQLGLVFEMFSQPHSVNGSTQSGLGIGLAMVRSLVDMHGGSVEARSDGPGRGSEFVVRLPLPAADTRAQAAQAAETGEALAHRRHMPLARRRTLVVDDNRDAADSLCHLLASLGADASAVYDGRAALDALEALRPHAIVLDIGMPGMDGYEVARAIRRDHRFDGVRIIALTGWGQHVDRLRSDASGFDYHLTKPADMALLESLLAQA